MVMKKEKNRKVSDFALFKTLYFMQEKDGEFISDKQKLKETVFGLGYTEQKYESILLYFKFYNRCRHCKQPIAKDDFDVVGGYWSNTVFACHSYCKKEQMEYEAYECQLIDADCNDCAFFKRGEIIEPITQKHKDIILGVFLNSPTVHKIGNPIKFHGFCEKHNIGTYAYPKTARGYTCFKHRKDK